MENERVRKRMKTWGVEEGGENPAGHSPATQKRLKGSPAPQLQLFPSLSATSINGIYLPPFAQGVSRGAKCGHPS